MGPITFLHILNYLKIEEKKSLTFKEKGSRLLRSLQGILLQIFYSIVCFSNANFLISQHIPML